MSFMCSKAFLLYIYIAVKTFAGGRAISVFKRISKTENMANFAHKDGIYSPEVGNM